MDEKEFVINRRTTEDRTLYVMARNEQEAMQKARSGDIISIETTDATHVKSTFRVLKPYFKQEKRK